MISRLVIDGIDVHILKEIPVSTNFAIADIKDPDKRGGTLSKTVVVPGTGDVNVLFENIFDVNIELAVFNPNVKVEAIYYLNEQEQFKGDLQLLKVNCKPSGDIEYECNIVGRDGSLFVAIGDALLTDIDFSDLDHTFNKTEQENSWATSYRLNGVATAFAYGSGYTYPFIKYGYSASDTSYNVNWFKPAIYTKEYVDRIFADAGFSYTSTFLTSTFFKHLIIPCNRDKIELSNAAISNSQYYIGKTASSTASWQSSNTTGNTGSSSILPISLNYNLETAPYFDASNQWDSAVNYYATIGSTGVYNVIAYGQADLTVQCAAAVGGTWTTSGATNNVVEIVISKNTGTGWVIIGYQLKTMPVGTVTSIGSALAYNHNVQTGNVNLNAGDLIKVTYFVRYQFDILDAGSTPVANGTAFTVDLSLPNGTTKNSTYLLRSDTAVYDGNTLSMNNAIPKNIKQKDFLKSLMQMFNLYCEIDKDKKDNYIIEPRETFYTANVNDWTDQLDYKKGWEVYPMKELDAINYTWKYKDDKDYYNDLYNKEFIDNYGLKRHVVLSDFIKGEKKTELVFSPTPLVSNSSNSIICPHIYSMDGTTIKPLSHNIRILYYGGLKSSGVNWNYVGLSGTTSKSQYPYAGHVDDANAPTTDLNFDYPNKVYYTYPLAYYTDNNLYNAHYSKFINEITDKDSKIIVCYIRLTETDIKNFTFRNKVFIRHDVYGAGYYVVNKIIDYDPLRADSTKVELLKLKRYDAFVASTIAIDVGSDTSDTARIAYTPLNNSYGNTETPNTLALGEGNRILGTGNVALASSRCFVDESSTGINLINCTEVSVIGGSNITVIGASNRAIDSTYDGLVINESGFIEVEVTASFSVDKTVDVYYVDCTGGDVTATFDVSSWNKKSVTFIRTDSSANLFKIDEVSGLPSVIGNAIPYDTGLLQYESAEISYKNNVFYIKG